MSSGKLGETALYFQSRRLSSQMEQLSHPKKQRLKKWKTSPFIPVLAFENKVINVIVSASTGQRKTKECSSGRPRSLWMGRMKVKKQFSHSLSSLVAFQQCRMAKKCKKNDSGGFQPCLIEKECSLWETTSIVAQKRRFQHLQTPRHKQTVVPASISRGQAQKVVVSHCKK